MEKIIIYIESYGCSANQNNSEIISGILENAGFLITNNKKIADLAIINTCVVKGKTEQKMCSQIEKLASKFNKLIVVGCMVDTEPEKIKELIKKTNKNCKIALVSVHNIKKILDALKKLIESKNIEFLEYAKEIKLNLSKIRKNKIIGVTQIASGCLGNCTYCYVKYAKGNLFSFPKKEILKNIKKDLDAGCKEIWLTSQDNASYGLDKGKNQLISLLKDILKINRRFKIRLGMMTPNHVLAILDELIKCYKDTKMFKFLHVPVQSGSDSVLKTMKRKYNVKDFISIIKKFRKEIPEITISTDIICGFPTETEKDWKSTLELIKKVRPNVLNISKFSSMPKTQARKMKKLPTEIIKKRATELLRLHLKIGLENNEKFIEKNYNCLVDERGFENTWIARNENYKIIVFPSSKNLFGTKIKLKVIKATPTYLIGKITQ